METSQQTHNSLSSRCSSSLPSALWFHREISAAQDRFTSVLERIYGEWERDRELVRMVMMTVGRGGQGDVGQRIRDEILVVQVQHRSTAQDSTAW